MKRYGIKYREVYEGFYEVEAESFSEAKKKLMADISAGNEDGPEECVESGCTAVYDEDI